MPNSLVSLLESLEPDPWRAAVGFSPEVSAASSEMFAACDDTAVQERVLNEWIKKYQPCIFGRAAATQEAISYCIVSPADLQKGDAYVRGKIEERHLDWTRQGHDGEKSAFILHVVSPLIAEARPSIGMSALARRVLSLYLQEEEVNMDSIYLDEIYLEVPNRRRSKWRWKAGINYFATQGDKRWWNDHRIPGGMAFSTNSVGHLVKSTQVSNLVSSLEAALEISPADYGNLKVASLEIALKLAMQTIAGASDAVSGRATELLPLPENQLDLPVPNCPVKLPPSLAEKNYCSYRGYYHTDHTLPSCYFADDDTRPASAARFDHLDFTYLFHSEVNNPSYSTMGTGVQVRAPHPLLDAAISDPKWSRSFPEEIDLAEAPRLCRAIQRS